MLLNPSRIRGLWTVLTLVITLLQRSAPAGDKIQIGGPQENAARVSFEQIDHQALHSLLQHYVDGRGQVCYSQWKRHRQDLTWLMMYLHSLGNVDPSLAASREATMAYYINAYNALTIWGVLAAYPLPSVQKINGKSANYRIFDDLELWVGDRYLSLNGIENDVLRPMNDPRIHFALVCGARGCPRLRNEAYLTEHLNWQLDDNAFEFFAHRDRFHISRLKGEVKISPILKWYGEDFGQNDYEIINRVFVWLPARDREWLSSHPGWKMTHLGYDWGLNDLCPTVSVRVGRMPYRMYSKVSPLLAPILESKASGSASSPPNQAPQHNIDFSPGEYGSPAMLPNSLPEPSEISLPVP